MSISWKGTACISTQIKSYPPAVVYTVSAGCVELSGLFGGPQSIWDHLLEVAPMFTAEQRRDLILCMEELFPHYGSSQ